MSQLQQKIDDAQQMIRETTDRLRSACLWSGGKDSMLVLGLLRHMGINPLVIFFREPWQPRKYRFAEGVIRDWELRVVTPHPEDVAYQQRGDEFELQNLYRINGTTFTCPTGIKPPLDSPTPSPWVCGLELSLRPLQGELILHPAPLTYLMGSKACDTDTMLAGDGGVRADILPVPGGAIVVNPIRQFTHQEVFAACRELHIPIDTGRYECVDGVWREIAEHRCNPDYVHACTACMDSRDEAAAVVDCPLYKRPVANAAAKLPWVEPIAPPYMRVER